ncbi:TMV resistance protein N-like [Punica granatum]|uniref:TMV resistance protein N-like n=2 Tax=Punica granatum TaxID=22663 RepID=A0A6P8BT57_PUNGR|nr:TMV resistance protein N-like [Punica granatum]
MAPKRKRTSGTTYQVFLSFRGPDTRQGFTDVLYWALTEAGIRVFRDNEDIRDGEDIGEEILTAIEESRIFVPIFSTNYASSKWCLIELAKMFKSKEASIGKKTILPIFYDVGVDDVMLKTKLYTRALSKHRKNFSTDIVHQWKEALRDAGKIKGWELKDTGYGEFARSFARVVSMKLKVKHKCVTDYLVQRDDQVEALMELLDIESSDVRFVGIHGMGGIGKTTLAKLVFNKLCDRFDSCSFLADVRESSRQHKGIELLQKKLLGDLGLRLGEIMDVDDGIIRMRERLAHKKVLIVLDDVDHSNQIQNLAGDASWFGSGSRILITTRDQSVLEIRRQRVHILEVEKMNPEEALRLFSLHAFDKDSPPNRYLTLTQKAVASSGRLPLALKLIGLLLRDKRRKEWVDTIKRLERILHPDVQQILAVV